MTSARLTRSQRPSITTCTGRQPRFTWSLSAMNPDPNPMRSEPLPYPDADGEFVRQCFMEMGGHASLQKVEAYVARALDAYLERRSPADRRRDAESGVLEAQFLMNRMHAEVIEALCEPGALDDRDYDLVTRTVRPRSKARADDQS